MHKFETLLESAVDRNFDRFELYALKNLFGVPEKVDIVLPHYEELDFDISVEKDQKLDEELELLRSQLIAVKKKKKKDMQHIKEAFFIHKWTFNVRDLTINLDFFI